MPGMLWVDGETYGVRAVKANEHECDWGNDYWTYVVDYNRAKEAFTSAMNELQDIAPDHSNDDGRNRRNDCQNVHVNPGLPNPETGTNFSG